MNTHIKTFLFGVTLVVLLQACYKDKGNYDLIDYNKIMSITTPTVGSVILGDTLRINPIITWKHPTQDTSAFEYEWRQIDSVVSKERNLKYTPNLPGYVMIYMYAKEKSTGIVSRLPLQIQVISAFKAGWLLLTNTGGQSDLNFLRRDTKRDANNVVYYQYKYYPNVYSTLFPQTPLGSNPTKIVTKAFPDYTLDEVLVLQGNESVFLSGDNFGKRIALRNEFPRQQFPDNARPIDYSDGTASNYVLFDNGNIYWKRNAKLMGGIHDGQFMDAPIYFEGGGANISQFIDASHENTSFAYIYDQLNKRFIGIHTTTGSNDYIGSKMYLRNASTPPTGWIELNNHTSHTMKYCSEVANGSSFMNVMKNNQTGTYMLQTYRLNMRYTFIDVSDQQQEVFAGSGLVSDNTVYHRIQNSSYLFFGEGSKLYFYDVNTKKVALYHDFGAGIIKHIQTDATSGELGVVTSNGTFAVCSLTTAVLGDANPGAVGILYQVHNIGNVVDLKWKWGSYFEYVLKRYPA